MTWVEWLNHSEKRSFPTGSSLTLISNYLQPGQFKKTHPPKRKIIRKNQVGGSGGRGGDSLEDHHLQRIETRINKLKLNKHLL